MVDDLIIKIFAINTASTFTRAIRITTLYDKPLDISVKLGVIVVTTCTQCKKVLASARRSIAEQLELEGTEISIDCDGHAETIVENIDSQIYVR
jgi:hypothetical protein